jgi:hypothetical protein
MQRVLTLVALATGPAFASAQHTGSSTTAPLFEPDTLAMASLGLLALGITLRRYRGR